MSEHMDDEEVLGMTELQWWHMVYQNWDLLFALCEEYLPMESKQTCDGEDCDKTVRKQILEAYDRRDRVLFKFLNETWWNSPDRPDAVQIIPGLKVLIELCTREPDSWDDDEE